MKVKALRAGNREQGTGNREQGTGNSACLAAGAVSGET
ncbi:argininosuccinate lyase [Lyngbya sp. PCC 8106]|nr:argininosuccinate lyase [Lyngbya sp. PCC 8106]